MHLFFIIRSNSNPSLVKNSSNYKWQAENLCILQIRLFLSNFWIFEWGQYSEWVYSLKYTTDITTNWIILERCQVNISHSFIWWFTLLNSLQLEAKLFQKMTCYPLWNSKNGQKIPFNFLHGDNCIFSRAQCIYISS